MRGSCRILLAVLSGLVCSACSVTRQIPEVQYLLRKVKIEDDRTVPRRDRILASELEKYVRQTPNKRFLGTNFYVWLYEQANPAKENRWNEWKRKIGEAPVLLDQSLTQKSAENLKVYMDSKGFFHSQVSYRVDTVSRRRRAKVVYRTHQGAPYRIDSISYEFRDKFLEQLILPDTSRSLLRRGRSTTSRCWMPNGSVLRSTSGTGATTTFRSTTSCIWPTRWAATGRWTSGWSSSSTSRGTTNAGGP